MRPLLIDCDPGIDDSVAIAYALRSGALDLKAITTVSGNLTADHCARNARQLLDLLGAPDIAVAQGPLKPLTRPYPRDPFSHGSDGLAEMALPVTGRALDPRFAPDVIIALADAYPGELEIACLGPMTNLALALIKDPGLPGKVKRVTAIFGSFGLHASGTERATGDNPVSEWNVYVDPEAARLVLEAGFDLVACGLDVTTRRELQLSAAHRADLAASARPEARLLREVTDFVERRGHGTYCGLIDSVAIATILHPDWAKTLPLRVMIECLSPLALGQTIVERRENFSWEGLSSLTVVEDFAFGPMIEEIVTLFS